MKVANYRAYMFTPHRYGRDMSISSQPLDVQYIHPGAVSQSILILTCAIFTPLELFHSTFTVLIKGCAYAFFIVSPSLPLSPSLHSTFPNVLHSQPFSSCRPLLPSSLSTSHSPLHCLPSFPLAPSDICLLPPNLCPPLPL